ncbi:MAG: hypothetical protein AAGU75_18825 [Bacillota bacterium]
MDAKTLASMLGQCSVGFTLGTYTYVTHQMQQSAAGKIDEFMMGWQYLHRGRRMEKARSRVKNGRAFCLGIFCRFANVQNTFKYIHDKQK